MNATMQRNFVDAPQSRATQVRAKPHPEMISAVNEKEAAMMRLEARRKTRTPESMRRLDPSLPEISGDLSAKRFGFF